MYTHDFALHKFTILFYNSEGEENEEQFVVVIILHRHSSMNKWALAFLPRDAL